MLLTIESMAYGGKGVARHEGKVYFVSDAVMGDVLEARIVADKGRYAEAEVARLVTPSPHRGPAPCAYASDCGGCQWQGIPYDDQLAWKKSFVVSSLTRIGKLPDGLEVQILGSPTALDYRNRILLRIHVTEAGEVRAGYFRRESRELVPITRCAIARPAVNRVVERIAALPLGSLPPMKIRCELQEILPEAGRDVVATVFPAEGGDDAVNAFVNVLGAMPEIHWVGHVHALKDAPLVGYDEGQLTMPGQFQQVNVAHNRTLKRLVKAMVDDAQPQRILDVFCGAGNLSLQLADGRRYVEGVELNRTAIAIARRSVDALMLSGATYLAGDAEKHLWKCARGGERFDLVILDPPRQGMYGGMVPLKKIAPKDVIYVSCDPTTLSRDLAYLMRKDLYRLESVTALDFFPNTYHVETVAHLRRTREPAAEDD